MQHAPLKHKGKQVQVRTVNSNEISLSIHQKLGTFTRQY